MISYVIYQVVELTDFKSDHLASNEQVIQLEDTVTALEEQLVEKNKVHSPISKDTNIFLDISRNCLLVLQFINVYRYRQFI